MEEVLAALESMEVDKTPGPNGFPTKFLKICWDVVGMEVMEVFETFCSKHQWSRSSSATFITLIPKKKDVSEVKDYHPISLVSYLYKVLAKPLVIRLKNVLSTVIPDM